MSKLSLASLLWSLAFVSLGIILVYFIPRSIRQKVEEEGESEDLLRTIPSLRIVGILVIVGSLAEPFLPLVRRLFSP
jgi:hypothetical protein